jgi:uncharacterized protein (TIGR02271 family)
MSKTITCLYQDEQKAAEIVSRLEQAGISRSYVEVYSHASDALIDELESAGVPRSDAHAYVEGVRRGRSLVAVECDEGEVDQVISILDDDGVLDLDEQQTSWRSEGWQGHEASAAGSTGGLGADAAGFAAALTGSSSTTRSGTDVDGDFTGSSDTTQARTDSSDASGRDEVIPIVEEELNVGKREVGHGRVRIQSRVVERPVEEQVNLREERVHVERRPVSGTAQAGSIEGDPFQERTIEVEERSQEAVVSKEARVTEELVVRKDVEERTETVSDTVRRTEVEVEDERNVEGTRTGTTGSSDRNP